MYLFYMNCGTEAPYLHFFLGYTRLNLKTLKQHINLLTLESLLTDILVGDFSLSELLKNQNYTTTSFKSFLEAYHHK